MSENKNEKKSNIFIMIKDMIKAWPLPVKIGTAIIILVVITGGTLYNNYLFTRELISIYNNTIPADEIDQMRNILSNSGYKEGVDFAVQKDDKKSLILVRRDLAGKIQDRLSGEGLPSNEDKLPETGVSSTQDQVDDARKRDLEQRIARDVKNIEGIKKATVRIVPASNALFEEDRQPGKASVYIEAKDGYKITADKTESIMALVANSVEGLEKKNVAVVDERGKILSDSIIAGDDPNGTIPLDVRQAREYDLQEKITKNTQEFLDGILGKGNSKVLVNVSLDFDGTERLMTVYGNPGGGTVSQPQEHRDTDGIITIGGRSIGSVNQDGTFKACGDEVIPESNGVNVLSMERLREKYNKTDGKEVSDTSPGYDRIEERFNYQLNSYQTKIVTATGNVKKISVALALNNVPEKYVPDLKQVVGASVGLDETRGDFISVINKPMMVQPVAGTHLTDMEPVVSGRNPVNLKALGWSVTVIIIFSLCIYALYLIKEKKSNSAKMKLCLTTGPSAGINSITDLVSDKGGRTAPPSTFKNFEHLTSMAKEKPNKVAELLKTSWMADKS